MGRLEPRLGKIVTSLSLSGSTSTKEQQKNSNTRLEFYVVIPAGIEPAIFRMKT